MESNFDRCTIYKSFYDFAQALPNDSDRGLFYTGIIEYSMLGKEPNFDNALLKSSFGLIKPVIDNSNKKRLNQAQAKHRNTTKELQNVIKPVTKELQNSYHIDKEKEIEKEIEIEKEYEKESQSKESSHTGKENKTTKRFQKPTTEEIRAYCQERKNNIDPEKFFNHYEAIGWKIGKNPMRDWCAAVRTWESNQQDNKSFGMVETNNAYNPDLANQNQMRAVEEWRKQNAS